MEIEIIEQYNLTHDIDVLTSELHIFRKGIHIEVYLVW